MNGRRHGASSLLDPASTVTLTTQERDQLDALADDVLAASRTEIDNPAWVGTVRTLSCDVPRRLRVRLRQCRRDPGCDGFLLLRGLPVDERRLPATPTAADSVQRSVSHPASLLALTAFQLGELIAYREEKLGALVHDVVPIPGMEAMQGNAGSDELELHVENAFHPNRPDFICLLCLRADRDGVAGLRVAGCRKVVQCLPESARRVLRERRYVTAAPASFRGCAVAGRPHAILEGSVDDPDLRVDFTSTEPCDIEAHRSMIELRSALARAWDTLTLVPGDLAIVDNRVAVHGRTAFQPRYDGRDRWLQRVYVQVDLRRSRDLRPGDGHVVESIHPFELHVNP